MKTPLRDCAYQQFAWIVKGVDALQNDAAYAIVCKHLTNAAMELKEQAQAELVQAKLEILKDRCAKGGTLE